MLWDILVRGFGKAFLMRVLRKQCAEALFTLKIRMSPFYAFIAAREVRDGSNIFPQEFHN